MKSSRRRLPLAPGPLHSSDTSSQPAPDCCPASRRALSTYPMLIVSMLVGITLGLPGKVHNQHAVLDATPNSPCVDNYEGDKSDNWCAKRAAKGYCSRDFVQFTCPVSCGTCVPNNLPGSPPPVAKSSDRVTYTNSGGGFAAMCAIEATPCASSRNRLCRDHQPV